VDYFLIAGALAYAADIALILTIRAMARAVEADSEE
jgi:hypothetical protein